MNDRTIKTTMANFDYRTLLIRYIDHVGLCEGVDFLSDSYPWAERFSLEEITELRKIAEIRPDYDDMRAKGLTAAGQITEHRITYPGAGAGVTHHPQLKDQTSKQ